MTLRLALRSDTNVNRTTGHATKNYKIAITLMNLLKLASIDKNRLSACYVNGSCVYTATLQLQCRQVDRFEFTIRLLYKNNVDRSTGLRLLRLFSSKSNVDRSRGLRLLHGYTVLKTRYTATLQIHRGVLIFIRSAKRSGALLWRYAKLLRHSVNAIVLNVVIF